MYYWYGHIWEDVKWVACPYCFKAHASNRKYSCINGVPSKNPCKEILIPDDVVFSP